MKCSPVTDWVVLKCDHLICIDCVLKNKDKLERIKECGCIMWLNN